MEQLKKKNTYNNNNNDDNKAKTRLVMEISWRRKWQLFPGPLGCQCRAALWKYTHREFMIKEKSISFNKREMKR